MRKSAEPAGPPSVPPTASLESLALRLETSVQAALGTDKTLVAIAAQRGLELLLRAACEELGSLSITVEASSSWQMITLPQKPGSVDSVSLSATGVSAGGFRVSSANLAFPRGLSAEFGSPFASPPTLPNLLEPAEASFSVRFSQDDLTRSPILFASLEALLREVIRSGASAAIGRVLPADSDALRIQLRSIESLRDGRVTLVADGSTRAEDGSNLTLEGLRVRTRVRVSRVEKLIVLQSPELISTFEGLGAKLEVGLPFLRGAGIPLPQWLDIDSLKVEDGSICASGTVRIQPINYEKLAAELQEYQRSADGRPPAATTVDADAVVADDDDGPASSRNRALPNAK